MKRGGGGGGEGAGDAGIKTTVDKFEAICSQRIETAVGK